MFEDSGLVYLNGEYLPLQRACVPVLDRGFLFGDGVYEVIPAYGGRPFRLREHLQRLRRGLAAIRVRDPFAVQEWARILDRLLAQRGNEDQSIYLQVTRGVDRLRDHAVRHGLRPSVFVMSAPLRAAPAQIGERGISAVTLDDIRWRRCDIKAITLLPNILLREQARDASALEAILVRDGLVTEGAASNLFVVLDGLLVTPPNGPYLLAGITRELVLELAASHGIACREAQVPGKDLEVAEEIWLTSSTREILPVTRLNGRPIGTGSPGPLWQRMTRLYQTYKRHGPQDPERVTI
jgi:D-alanine transaminase